MRRRAKVFHTGVSLLAMTSLLLAGGCGTAGPGASRDRIQVWALQDPQNEPVIEAGLGEFNRSSPVRAELVTYVNDAYKQKLHVSMGSPNAPDVFFNWGGGNLAEFVNANQVVDLSHALAARPEVRDAFLPSVLAVGRISNGQYGLPMNGIQPVVLFYHKGVFQKAGLEPPKTWSDLLSLVDAFKSRKITPIALPGSQGWTELMYLEYLLDRIGGPDRFSAIAAQRSGAWRDPSVLRALQMCQELAERGAFGSNFASINYDNTGASKLFATGKAAMFLMGSWEYTSQLSNNPDFVKRGDLGWTTFPTVDGGNGDPANVVGNPANYFSVAASSPHVRDATTLLIETLASDAYVRDLVNSGQVPAVAGVEAKLAGTPNAEFATFTYEMVAKAPSFTQSWDQALSPAVGTEMLTNLQKLFLSDITPDEFVDAMEKAS
jgi:raffinose/stachyose/melibiose transport system substrate-binding protein/xylobiose transport system substrate-binding protein